MPDSSAGVVNRVSVLNLTSLDFFTFRVCVYLSASDRKCGFLLNRRDDSVEVQISFVISGMCYAYSNIAVNYLT